METAPVQAETGAEFRRSPDRALSALGLNEIPFT